MIAWGTYLFSFASVASDHKCSGLKYMNLSSYSSVRQKANMGPTELKSHTIRAHTTLINFKSFSETCSQVMTSFSFNYDEIN